MRIKELRAKEIEKHPYEGKVDRENAKRAEEAQSFFLAARLVTDKIMIGVEIG
jgi:F0F1-type ATP synthase assembly protein I